MRKLLGPRFGIEVGIIVAVAAVLGLLEASWPAVAGGIFATWVLIAVVEIVLSRDTRATGAVDEETGAAAAPDEHDVVVAGAAETRAPAPESASEPEQAEAFPDVEPPAVVPPLPPPADDPSTVLRRAAAVPLDRDEPSGEPQTAAVEIEPEPESEPEPEPDGVPAAAVEPVAEEPPPDEPEPEPEPVAATPPPPPVLTAVPPSPPEPQPEAAPPTEPEPAGAPDRGEVVELRPGAPREWNLWELERLAREHAGGDPVRDEEWSFLLMYLREFASADGALPRDFDQLVRETFGEALHAPR